MCRLNNPFESFSICNQDTTVVLKNMQVVIRSANSHKEMNEYMKSTRVYTAFLLPGQAFWKENIEDRVKLLELNILNCYLRTTMANLRKIGLKMRE